MSNGRLSIVGIEQSLGFQWPERIDQSGKVAKLPALGSLLQDIHEPKYNFIGHSPKELRSSADLRGKSEEILAIYGPIIGLIHQSIDKTGYWMKKWTMQEFSIVRIFTTPTPWTETSPLLTVLSFKRHFWQLVWVKCIHFVTNKRSANNAPKKSKNRTPPQLPPQRSAARPTASPPRPYSASLPAPDSSLDESQDLDAVSDTSAILYESESSLDPLSLPSMQAPLAPMTFDGGNTLRKRGQHRSNTRERYGSATLDPHCISSTPSQASDPGEKVFLTSGLPIASQNAEPMPHQLKQKRPLPSAIPSAGKNPPKYFKTSRAVQLRDNAASAPNTPVDNEASGQPSHGAVAGGFNVDGLAGTPGSNTAARKPTQMPGDVLAPVVSVNFEHEAPPYPDDAPTPSSIDERYVDGRNATPVTLMSTHTEDLGQVAQSNTIEGITPVLTRPDGFPDAHSAQNRLGVDGIPASGYGSGASKIINIELLTNNRDIPMYVEVDTSTTLSGLFRKVQSKLHKRGINPPMQGLRLTLETPSCRSIGPCIVDAEENVEWKMFCRSVRTIEPDEIDVEGLVQALEREA